MEEKKWYRVIDPLSPLYGCDVLTESSLTAVNHKDFTTRKFLMVKALRRVDVFVGDRPFQLIAKDGDDLGLMVDRAVLEDSPIQDETVETGTDRPHGICLDESEMTRVDGHKLKIVKYEKAIQIALLDHNGKLLATNTDSSDGKAYWEDSLVRLFVSGADPDDIVYTLRNS